MGNADWNDPAGRRDAPAEDFGGFGGQNALNGAVFVPGPQQGGHAPGGDRFGDLGQAVNATVNADPVSGFDVVKVDAVGIADFNRLRGGEAPVLAFRQFPQFFGQSFRGCTHGPDLVRRAAAEESTNPKFWQGN